MNNKIGLVAQREFVENLRTKAFWIGILTFPILIVLGILIPIWLERNKATREYAVIDESGWLLEAIEQRAAMPDLEKVFGEALTLLRASRDADGAQFDALPEELRNTATQLDAGLEYVLEQKGGEVAELEQQIVGGFASMVAGFAGTRGAQVRELLPEEVVAEMERLRGSIQDWWLALPAEEAERYGSGLDKSRYQRVDAGGTGPEAVDELGRRVADGDLFAYFVIGEDPVGGDEGSRYVSANLTDDDLRNWFSRLASDVVRDRRLAERNIDSETARWVQAPLRFQVSKVGEEGAEEEVAEVDFVRQWAPVAFVYLLWISVFTIAQMLLTNTIEEKSNRLMEVLLSSVSPIQLMVGKILGIAATGLTMLSSWLIFFYLVTKYVPRFFDADLPFDLSVIARDPLYIFSFLVYFLLGYLLFASLLVGIGSVCNSLKEAQNLMQPVILVMMVPLFLMLPIGRDPNGLLARVTSYIPPLTPFVMMNRAAGPPTTLEYVVTSILLLVTVGLVMWAAAKVFRIGVLMTGKPPKLLEIVRWIRAPVGLVPERKS